ncbi:putative bifunctional diguanylate cyclase/phosphodiesterase [Alicyclobacillus sp. ALC3]|uniref:putative bifunctional diguanylate cyclase/phosphodiesterase n=1 Tax=Alicyclobacillus sp. ALC3 TaxID=2796143 RepID=UPI002379C39D|nr:bifunctional diguanylate cyclase/phosphodiesterase [Alicyclobacillus sp. ALC3]WDL97538.1 bifunctional diguanylate cyclase/phosphodiesterase [Alicyclobacillus sp. ALC3]
MLSILANGTFRQAANQMLDILGSFIPNGTLFVAVNDGRTNAVVAVRNRGECLVSEGFWPLSRTYCSLVCAVDDILVIDDASRHPQTSAFEITKMLGAVSFAGIPIENQSRQRVGTVCFIDDGMSIPSTEQLKVMRSAAGLLAHAIDLETAIYRDPITMTYTRRYLDELFANWHRQFQRIDAFVLNLDKVKLFANVEGYAFGEQLVASVAQRLKEVLHPDDEVVRIGEEEFAILSHRLNSVEDARMIGERLLGAFRMPLTIHSRRLLVSPRMGAAAYPDSATDVQQLINHAAVAMYSVAHPGTRINFYHPTDASYVKRRLDIEDLLPTALDNQEFEVHYQPKFLVQQGNRIGSVEALLRWKRANGEWISPTEFIPVAETTGLIEPLGRFVLWTACAQNRAWQDAGYPAMVVSVNISPKQFQAGHVFQEVQQVLLQTGLDPEWLAIEITEGCLMENSLAIVQELQNIRELGVKIAIDDFGTGYSSLAYLRRFQPTHLKIDQVFVRTMLEDFSSLSIVTGTIQLAHSLGMKVVAEGVEEKKQLEILQGRGCDMVQGFLLAKPLPADQIEAMFRTGPVISEVL